MNIKELAEHLHLSISTVSRALNDSYDISPITRARVLEMAAMLNYQAHPYASSLRKHTTKNIAVVIPEITNNFFSQVISGIEDIAQQKDYHIIIYITHDNLQKEIFYINHLLNGRVDGVIMSLSAQTNNYDHLLDLRNKGIPIVFFDRICEAFESSHITTDDYESGFAATRHLIENGCKRIAYLGFLDHLSISRKRMEGYLAALQHYEIAVDESLILRSANSNSANEKMISELLQTTTPPDGMFAAVEKMAIATYNVCHQLQISIPQQLKIISFSNLEIAPLLKPGLSTITQPAFEIGQQSAKQLFRYFEKKSYKWFEKIILNSALIPRESTIG